MCSGFIPVVKLHTINIKSFHLSIKNKIGFRTGDLIESLPSKCETELLSGCCAYNPSYSGGRDQEDHSSTPAQANSSQDPVSKELITEKGLVEWLDV
jgi:hypothetical protein